MVALRFRTRIPFKSSGPRRVPFKSKDLLDVVSSSQLFDILSLHLLCCGDMLRSEMGVAGRKGFWEPGAWLEGILSYLALSISLV